MPQDRLQYLLDKFFNGTCTMEEKQELALWVEALKDEDQWKHQLGEVWSHFMPKERMGLTDAENILETVFAEESKQAVSPRPKSRIQGMYRVSIAAASVIGILMALSIIYVNKNFRPAAHTQPTDLSQATTNIAPGGNKAILVLSNGKKILLDSAKDGALVQIGNIQVSKSGSGQLIFRQSAVSGNHSNEPAPLQWNTLQTPAGGQYQIDLPDGSKAWLNAASSLRFPSAFTGADRRVEMTGEVYFEIAKNARQPFSVDVVSPQGQNLGKVLVLGTSFNVNAYTDESTVKATLLEGKVKIDNPARSHPATLSPGEQAIVHSNGDIDIAKGTNTAEVVAWKNGLFDFDGNDIQSVMRQIARWYNVEVKYETVPTAHFMGTISRNVEISEVLKMLEMTGAVHFKLEGRTIVVLS